MKDTELRERLVKELKWWEGVAAEADMYGGEIGRARALAMRDMATELWKIVRGAAPSATGETK